MKDERDELLDQLFQAARAMKPNTDLCENHFETRLRARIAERQNEEAEWSAWTWRLVPIFFVMVIAIGIGTVYFDAGRSPDLSLLMNGFDEYASASLVAGG